MEISKILKRWRTITSAPTDRTVVWMTDGEVAERGYFVDGYWRSVDEQCHLWAPPSHWMPLECDRRLISWVLPDQEAAALKEVPE